jgi:hypothetical protein
VYGIHLGLDPSIHSFVLPPVSLTEDGVR